MPEAVWQQPASATSTSRVIEWLAWATGVVSILVSLAIIERAPMPWLDEVYLVSVSNSVAQGSDRAARLVPPPEWVDGYEKTYGPVFFHTEAAAIRLFGLSPFSGRITGWAGSVLLAFSSAWLILIVGGSSEMASIRRSRTCLSRPPVQFLLKLKGPIARGARRRRFCIDGWKPCQALVGDFR